MTVLVTGARGGIARALIARLTSAGTPLRVASSHPGPGEVRLDLRTGEGAAEALDGVDQVLLYTQPDGVEAFLRAAQGVRHIVQVSSAAVLSGSGSIADRHKVVEDALLGSGLPTTVLRPGAFAANTLRWAESIRATSTVELVYPDARYAPIHEDDIAAVAQTVLDAGTHVGEALTLTGPEPLSYRQQVAILAEVLDRPISVAELSRQRAVEQRPAFIPAEVMAELLDSDARYVEGPPLLTDTVAAVTGVPARDFRSWAVEHRAAFLAPRG